MLQDGAVLVACSVECKTGHIGSVELRHGQRLEERVCVVLRDSSAAIRNRGNNHGSSVMPKPCCASHDQQLGHQRFVRRVRQRALPDWRVQVPQHCCNFIHVKIVCVEIKCNIARVAVRDCRDSDTIFGHKRPKRKHHRFCELLNNVEHVASHPSTFACHRW